MGIVRILDRRSSPTADLSTRGRQSVKIDRLSTVDLVDLAVETPDNTMNIGALVRLEGGRLLDSGQLRIAEIRAELARHVAGLPRLRQVVTRPGLLGGRPLWTDDPKFRIERHVGQVQLAPPGDEPALLRLTADLLRPRMDLTRPLWRMWFVTGLPDGEIAVVVAMHHVLADGAAALELLRSLLDGPAAAREYAPAPRPRWAELVRDNARGKVATLARRRRRPADPARVPYRQLIEAWRAPRTSLNAPVGPARTLRLIRLDLSSVRRAAHAHGATVNDVVLTLAAGGLRALLAARGEDTSRIVLRAGVAVSLRAAGQPVEPGNRTGAIMVRLPLDEADPRVRLRQVHTECAAARSTQVSTVAGSVMLQLARVGLLRPASRHQRLTNIIESDVIGPREPLHLLGARVIDLVPIGNLAGNLSVAFLALSYLDQARDHRPGGCRPVSRPGNAHGGHGTGLVPHRGGCRTTYRDRPP